MRQYLDLLRRIMDEGVTVQTGAYLPAAGRKPTARRLHAAQIQFDLAAGFPAVTTKPLFWRGVVAEWIWFMAGDPNVSWLRDEQKVAIWNQWADETGYLGPVYGQQFRAYQGVGWVAPKDYPTAEEVCRSGVKLDGDGPNAARFWYDESVFRVRNIMGPATSKVELVQGPVLEVDQIGNARDDIRAVVADPFNRARRRIVVTLWNPAQVPDMALPPCHTFHMYDLAPPTMTVGRDGSHTVVEPEYHLPGHPEAGLREACDRWTLSLHLFARSIDAVKGLPFNLSSYGLMLLMMAGITGTRPGTLTITFNDVHIYDNQFQSVEEQLGRAPHQPPTLNIDDALAVCRDLTVAEARRLTPSMFKLVGYESHPKLTAESEIAV